MHDDLISAFNPSDHAPLSLSITPEHKWQAVSQLQKAIRRGQPSLAVEWARALWNADRSYGLYRMAVIAAEEVAGANPELAAAFLRSDIRRAWFEARGGFKAMAYFAFAFAQSPKDRASCDLSGLASASRLLKLSPPLGPNAAASDLSRLALDDTAPAPTRLSALWQLLGTAAIPNPAFGEPFEGDYVEFSRCCAQLCDDPDMLVCIQRSLALNKEPNPIGLALCRRIALAEGASVSNDPPSVPTSIRGSYLMAGIDTHTREGKTALASWLSASSEIQRVCAPLPSRAAKLDFLGACIFRLEGHEVTPKLRYPTEDRIQQWKRKMLARSARMEPQELFDLLARLLPELDDHRVAAIGPALAAGNSTPSP